MTREDIVNTARAILAKAGFDVSSNLRLRSICFNFVARRDETLIVVKVLGNVDAFTRAGANELKTLSEALGGNPLVIGEGTGSGPLEDGIVYTRFKIPIISVKTLSEYLIEDVPPFIFAAPGGLYVNLDGDTLRDIRNTQNISLGALAEAAGVSRRTIQLYETGMGAMIDAALRLEEFLNTPLIEPLDPFSHGAEEREKEGSPLEKSQALQTNSPSLDRMMTIGYTITPIVRSPFDAVSRDKDHGIVVLTGVDSQDTALIDRAIAASELSNMSKRPSVIIVRNKPAEDSIANTALVSDDELKKIDDMTVLNDLILTRSTRR